MLPVRRLGVGMYDAVRGMARAEAEAAARARNRGSSPLMGGHGFECPAPVTRVMQPPGDRGFILVLGANIVANIGAFTVEEPDDDHKSEKSPLRAKRPPEGAVDDVDLSTDTAIAELSRAVSYNASIDEVMEGRLERALRTARWANRAVEIIDELGGYLVIPLLLSKTSGPSWEKR